MKKQLLTVAVGLCLSQGAYAAHISDARSAGSAGVGIASGDYTRTNLNPALLTRFQDDDDLYLKLGVGIHAKDFQETQDNLDDLVTELDNFSLNPTQAGADNINDMMAELGNQPVNAEGNVGLAIYTPSKTIAVGFTVTSELMINGGFLIDENDKNLIDGALTNPGFDPNQLHSEGLVRAAAVSDIKLAIASEFNLPYVGEFAVGITPKFQRIDSFIYVDALYGFEIDQVTDQTSLADNGFNLDIGLHKAYGPMQFALVGKNLISRDVTAQYLGAVENWTLKPTYTLGVAFQQWGLTLATDIDLVEDKSFVLESADETFLLSRQWARVGAEYDIGEWLQIRAGYKTDLSSNYEDQLTAGIGLSPFDMLTVDIAAQFADDDDMGASVQLGFKF